MKRALITGGSGQDGYYLSQLLMDKGYDVYSVVRRSSVDNFTRINKLNKGEHFEVLYGDLTDTSGLMFVLVLIFLNTLVMLTVLVLLDCLRQLDHLE
jgi:GDPmannose 4,6-dehydratase